MRLSVMYHCEKIPMSYRMMFVSLIKAALEKENKEYFDKLYGKRADGNTLSKDFTFGVTLRNYEKKEDEFLMEGPVIFTISSPSYEFMIHLHNGLLSLKNYVYKSYELKLERLMLLPEKKVTRDIALFETVSPICIKRRTGEFITFENEDFEKELNYIANITLQNYRGGKGLKSPLIFKPVQMIKKVVKEKITGFKEKTSKDTIFINVSMGSFFLEGHSEDLNDLLQLGLGFRRNQSYGLLDLC